ncbi:hypothetical protein HMSSN036_57650 [Paenibacillus macerans]|nr:hypothetical protein HMSSN036_57650 [Paenibacillus macerans]
MNTHLKNIHPLSWTIIVGTIFGRMATSMSIPFLSIYLIKSMGATASETGIVVAVSSLIGVFASFYGGYISDVIGRKRVLYISISAGRSCSSALLWRTRYGYFSS